MDTSSIYLTRWGQSGPRIVMVHGGGQGSPRGGDVQFAAQKALAERGWQIIAPDRPGHARSPDPGRPDDTEADGAWVADLLEDGAHLVGHSYGGAVALNAAARRPQAVRSLTVIEPAMQKMATHDPRVRKLIIKMIGILLFSFSDVTRARRVMKLLGIPPEINGKTTPDQLRRLGRALREIRLPSRQQLESQIDTIKQAGIPLLVVTGGWNPAFEGVGDVVAARGNGQRLVVPAPHHFPHLVNDQFNIALEAFMKAADARRAQ